MTSSAAVSSAADSNVADANAADWQRWRERRAKKVLSPYGIASLVSTNWVTETPIDIEGIDGQWSATDGQVVSSTGVRLAPGDPDLQLGTVRVRAIEREGALALRVFDPDAASRTSLREIAAFPPADEWTIVGEFEPAPEAHLDIEHVGGWVEDAQLAGHVAFELDGARYRFAVTAERDRYFAVFADQTNGRETKQFRFLNLPPADDLGKVLVDFNAAYLPPCAFSDAYFCPLPPASNRLAAKVLAGESWPSPHVDA